MTIAKAQLAVLILTGIAIASPSPGATLKVGPNQTYKAPSAAAAVAKNGDHIEIQPGQYFDCAVWNADDLVIEGIGPGVVITDKACMGKGLFVIEGNNTTVRNLTLTRSRVPDMNGAGIRLDKGNLTVDTVKFIDNQNGILGGVPGTTVTIRNSDFDRNGICTAACAHGIYIENVDLLRVENSRFSNTRQVGIATACAMGGFFLDLGIRSVMTRISQRVTTSNADRLEVTDAQQSGAARATALRVVID